jgi:chromatin segregation and condensation protein Rec8/ScpA/Scc1 (kleisin family)
MNDVADDADDDEDDDDDDGYELQAEGADWEEEVKEVERAAEEMEKEAEVAWASLKGCWTIKTKTREERGWVDDMMRRRAGIMERAEVEMKVAVALREAADQVNGQVYGRVTGGLND